MDSVRHLEKDNEDLRAQLDERVKTLKAEISKKDSVIRLMKEREMSDTVKEMSRIEVKTNEEELLHEQIRRLKSELERKDSLVKIYKEKIEKLEDDIESLERTHQ